MAFKWDFNLGHMLTAVPLVVLGTVYIVTDHNAVATLTTNYNDIKAAMEKGFDTLRNDIRSLPVVQANMDQFKAALEDSRRTADSLKTGVNADHEAALRLGNRVDDLTDKVGDLRSRVSNMEPILDNLNRASKIQLGRKN